MTILDRYLVRTLIVYSAMVMGVLLMLGGLFVFIDQQDDIGVGRYTMGEALFFSLLNLPQQAFELMPIGVLLGSLLGLGALARGSELVVVRASGVSILRVARAVAIGGVLVALLTALLGEFVAPPLYKFARQEKAFTELTDVSIAGAGGVWVKDGDTTINVQEQTGDNLFGGVYVYRFKGPQELASLARADRATVVQDGRSWRLDRYAETRFEGNRVFAGRQAFATLATRVDPGFLGLAVSEPRQLASLYLLRLIRYLQANGIETRSYELALWSRTARTCAIVLVALLAVPLAFGPLRSSGAGARLMIGVLIGLVFFLLQRLLEGGTIVFDLNPVVLAWLPTALLAMFISFMIALTR
jgi:lipopolysaccharide export system permease protein